MKELNPRTLILSLLFITCTSFAKDAFGQYSIKYDNSSRVIGLSEIGTLSLTYDNVGNRITLTKTNPSSQNPSIDLLSINTSQAPPSIPKGSSLELTFDLQNDSEEAQSNIFNQLYWSRENMINEQAISLKTDYQNRISPNQTLQKQLSITLPDTLSDGAGFLLIKVDSKYLIEETDEDNNTIVIPITIDNSLIPERTIKADFQASLQYICPGSTVFFDDVSNGEPTEWLWEFEGGLPATSNEQNPRVVYEQAGTYQVKLTAKDGDIEGAKEQIGFIIVEGENDNSATTVAIEHDQGLALCEQSSITLKAPDGFTGYFWSNGETSQEIEVIEPGDYTLMVRKCNEEEIESEAVTVVQETIEVVVADIKYPTCTTPGQLAIAIDQEDIEYNVTWSHGAEGNTLIDVEAGYYEATITTESGCEKTFTINLPQSELPTFSIEKTDATCGEENGILTVLVDDPELYDIEWSNDENTLEIDGLNSGNYIATITDKSTGCSRSQSVFVDAEEALLLEFEIDIINTTCGEENGSASIDFEGIENFDIAWNGTVGESSISNLSSGTYELLLTDKNTGCTQISTFDIEPSETVFPEFEIDINGTTCGKSNGSAQIELENIEDFEVSWDGSNGDQSITELMPGSHILTLTHKMSGCVLEKTYEVPSSENPIPDFQVLQNNTTCGNQNGSASLDITNTDDFEIIWDGQTIASSIENLSAGTYEVEVRHKETGCFEIKTFEIQGSEDDSPDLVPELQSTTCGEDNGSAVFDFGGNNFVIKMDGEETTSTLENLAAGDYTVTLINNESDCSREIQFTIEGSEAIEDFELGGPETLPSLPNAYELPDPGLGGTWSFVGDKQGVLQFNASTNKWYFMLAESGLGTYQLAYTVEAMNCTKQDILEITVDTLTDIVDEVYQKTGIRLFPNPSDTEIFIKKENVGTEQLRSLELINELGKSLSSKIYTESIFEDTWKVSPYPSGLYFMVIETNKGVYKLKVLIKH